MKFLLMYNPVSGRANFKSNLAKIIKEFSKTNHEIDIYESKEPKDLEKVSAIESKHYDVFLVAGGDGTVNEVLNGMMNSEKKPILGLLPSGTANDIAAILGINKNIKRSLKIYFNEKPVEMDVNQLNERYFLYTVASGILSRISYDVTRRHIKKYGYFAYVIEAMKDFSHDYRYPVKVKYDHQYLSCECVMILGLSTNRVGGMSLVNFSESKLNDGLFELRFFKRAKSFWRFRLLSSFIRGGKKLREDIHLVSSKFEIETSSNVEWNVDGEYACKGNIVIKTQKKAIKVFASPKRKKRYF
ncbi:diacylglycerol/lipid kinase family protein [Peloplasma aerotolerans]|jgi:diacylglycerol kinase (ATP)|uniref:Diacylglycerol kinase family lipid kinase n=1 Tax=Peloplasma aerotolerans TaxID=3044389 RepID=A0AAW6U8S9_9MOLU|nr:diacylglycerol kinase family protein [Mariniplasma sp. M4Ah]MDI6453125.1 diacylglycerol kinase family lipid kinase [Mariniplasma sp. M4Ah]